MVLSYLDDVHLVLAAIATQTITDVAWGDEFVVPGANFTGDTVSLDTTTNVLTVDQGTTPCVSTMDDVTLAPGANEQLLLRPVT